MKKAKQATGADAAESGGGIVTIVGGVELEVTHLPAEVFTAAELKRIEKHKALLGTTQRVKVRQVRVDMLQVYGTAVYQNDEATMIDVYVGAEHGWAATLTPESADAIAEKGLEINLPLFGAWHRRQAKARDQMAPTAIVELATKLAELQRTVNDRLSPTSAATSPSTTG